MSDSHNPPGSSDSKPLHAAIAAANAAASAATAAAYAATAAASAAAVIAANLDNTTSALSSPKTSDQPFRYMGLPFRFMDLPAELRIEIYGYLVIVGKVFYKPDDDSVLSNPHFKDFRAYRKPDLSIFRVSKAVYNEAEEVYLSQNLFVLPALREEHFENYRTAPVMFSKNASEHIKHISIGLSGPFSPRTLRSTQQKRETTVNAFSSFQLSRLGTGHDHKLDLRFGGAQDH
jgi:hypothetical protein